MSVGHFSVLADQFHCQIWVKFHFLGEFVVARQIYAYVFFFSEKLHHINVSCFCLFSEFDMVTFVVHVGEVYKDSHQKKQWVFVTDGSIPELQLEELPKSLLAINFSSAYIDDDSFLPINYNLVGSTVSVLCLFNSELWSP